MTVLSVASGKSLWRGYEYYLENKTMLQIADLLDISHQRVRQIRVNAERHLRADKELRELYLEHYQQRYKPNWKYFDWQPERCVLSRTR